MQRINREQGHTILTVTHNPYIASHCGRVLYLRDGKMQRDIRKTQNQTEAEFMRQLIQELYAS